MLTWLRARSAARSKASNLYGALVAQARQPAFYAECGVPDTPNGRYEMIVLHLALLIERLTAEGEAGTTLARQVGEAFVTDMDDCAREMGVGDLSVPKKVNRAAAGLLERTLAYRAALAEAADDRLSALIGEHVLADATGAGAPDRIAAYARAAKAELAAMERAQLLDGRLGNLPAP